MARHNPVIAFDAKMYKHFAIVTVALTGGVALLADGESREAVADTAQAVAEYEPDKSDIPTLIINNPEVENGGNLDGFYRDSTVELNSAVSIDSSISAIRSLDRYSRIDSRRLAQVGLTMEEFRKLSAEKRADVLKKLNNGLSVEERRRTIAEATAASLERSGLTKSADF